MEERELSFSRKTSWYPLMDSEEIVTNSCGINTDTVWSLGT